MSNKDVAESIFLLEKVHEYYSSAFDQALVVVGIVFGLVGVVVPLGISFFQARQARKELDSVKEAISVEVARQLQSVSDDLKRGQDVAIAEIIDRNRDELQRFRESAEQQFVHSKAGLFHIQSLHLKGENKFESALLSASKAASRYFECSDVDNLRNVVNVAEYCVSQIKDGKKAVRAIKEFGKVVELLEGAKTGTGVADVARDAREALESAKGRLANSANAAGENDG